MFSAENSLKGSWNLWINVFIALWFEISTKRLTGSKLKFIDCDVSNGTVVLKDFKFENWKLDLAFIRSEWEKIIRSDKCNRFIKKSGSGEHFDTKSLSRLIK